MYIINGLRVCFEYRLIHFFRQENNLEHPRRPAADPKYGAGIGALNASIEKPALPLSPSCD
jgi:hypothetical protein